MGRYEGGGVRGRRGDAGSGEASRRGVKHIRIHRASLAVDSGRRNTYFTSTNSNYWQY